MNNTRSFSLASGLPGLAKPGKDGIPGNSGLSTYITDYSGDNDTFQLTSKIASNISLMSTSSDVLQNGRVYNTGDLFLDAASKFFRIDLTTSNLYVYTGVNLTSAQFFDFFRTTPGGFDRYVSTINPNLKLVDFIYSKSNPNYLAQNQPIYGVDYINYETVAYNDIPTGTSNVLPYQVWLNNGTPSDQKQAMAFVRDGNNTNLFRIGNLVGGVQSNTNLSLDFSVGIFNQDMSVNNKTFLNKFSVKTLISDIVPDMPFTRNIGAPIYPFHTIYTVQLDMTGGTMQSNFIPITDNSYKLGSIGAGWSNLYTNNASVNALWVGNLNSNIVPNAGNMWSLGTTPTNRMKNVYTNGLYVSNNGLISNLSPVTDNSTNIGDSTHRIATIWDNSINTNNLIVGTNGLCSDLIPNDNTHSIGNGINRINSISANGITMYGDIVPVVDNIESIGDVTTRFNYGYFVNASIGTGVFNSVNSGNASIGSMKVNDISVMTIEIPDGGIGASSWITASLGTGWSGIFQYKKNKLGDVQVRIANTTGAMSVSQANKGNYITTLPLGYRPTYIINGYLTSGVGSGGSNYIYVLDILANGNVGLSTNDTTNATIYLQNTPNIEFSTN